MTEKIKKMMSVAASFKQVGSESFFRAELDSEGTSLFYSPGCSMIVEGELNSSQLALLRKHGIEARESINKVKQEVALTLFLHNDCDQNCSYCLRHGSTMAGHRLSWADVEDHLSHIIENCRNASVPVTVVFHGWGEPLFCPDQIRELTGKIDEKIKQAGLERYFYIATHGVSNEEQIELLTSRFDYIGLSCDGPPDGESGRGSKNHDKLLNTAAILRQRGRSFDVRMTVTPEMVEELSGSVRYIARELSPNNIRLEPQYGPNGENIFVPEDIYNFYHHFMLAREAARSLGYTLQTSISRPDEIHGPYCNPLRGVRNIMPDGSSTPCFADYDGSKVKLFSEKSRSTRLLQALPEKCRDCFNQYHCIRGCPEYCVLEDNNTPEGSFRCLLSQVISIDWILQHIKDQV